MKILKIIYIVKIIYQKIGQWYDYTFDALFCRIFTTNTHDIYHNRSGQYTYRMNFNGVIVRID